jgi:carboxylesterase type B
LARVFELYPRLEFNSTFWQRQTLFGDFIINCPTRWVSEAVELLGNPAYKMVFNAGNQLHGATVPFLFDPAYGCELLLDESKVDHRLMRRTASPNDNITLANQMKDWYISFATYHNPNRLSPHKFTWPSYYSLRQSPGDVLIVNSTTIGARADPDMNIRCSFWHSQSAVTRN